MKPMKAFLAVVDNISFASSGSSRTSCRVFLTFSLSSKLKRSWPAFRASSMACNIHAKLASATPHDAMPPVSYNVTIFSYSLEIRCLTALAGNSNWQNLRSALHLGEADKSLTAETMRPHVSLCTCRTSCFLMQSRRRCLSSSAASPSATDLSTKLQRLPEWGARYMACQGSLVYENSSAYHFGYSQNIPLLSVRC